MVIQNEDLVILYILYLSETANMVNVIYVHMLLNTSHIELFSILCIQFVLCMDCQSMKEKRICHRAHFFHNLIWKFSEFGQ